MLSKFVVEITGVASGDTIVAFLTLIDSNANVWNIKLSETTNEQTFNLTVNCNSLFFSGEWIVERQSINNQISTLGDFGNVPFSNCQIKLNNVPGPISNFTYSKIQTANQLNAPLASVSTLGPDGSSFTVSHVAGS